MNYDQWSLLYNHVIVVGSKITIRVHDNTVVAGAGMVAGILLSDDTIFTNDPVTMMEQGLAKYKLTNPGPNSGGGNGVSLRHTFSAKKFFNLTDILDNYSRLGHDTLDNPTDPAFFVCFLGPPPGSLTDLSSYVCTVIIDYICVFSEPKEQPLS